DNVIRTETTDEWCLFGPFETVQLVRDEPNSRKVNEQAVRYELFTTCNPTGTQQQAGRHAQDDAEHNNGDISINLDGLYGSVESPESANETLLNATLRARPDVPFACAGGVCGTCRAKLVEGQVEMAENFALEKDEIDAGYILTCQS